MDTLNIVPSRTTPKVDFNKESSTLDITGQSYPENAFQFFSPITQWLQDFVETKPDELTVNFKLDYFNTSSSKCLLDILEILENYHQSNGKVKVYWHYEQDDEDMEDSGHDFGADLELPFELVAYQDA